MDFGLIAVSVAAVVIFQQCKPMLLRLVEAREGNVAKPSTAKPDEPIPHTLWILANQETTEWARADAMKIMREKYEESGKDWDSVLKMFKE